MGSRPAPWRASNGSRRAREATRASAECGARNAELQWRVLHVWQAGRPDARRDIPHSTFRIPHLRKRSEEHTSELQSRFDLVCRLLLEKKKKTTMLHKKYTQHD